MLSPWYDMETMIGEELFITNFGSIVTMNNIKHITSGHISRSPIPETITGKIFYKNREYDLKVDAKGNGGVVNIYGNAMGDKVYPVSGSFTGGTDVFSIYWNERIDKKDVRIILDYEFTASLTPADPESEPKEKPNPEQVRSIFDDWEVSQT